MITEINLANYYLSLEEIKAHFSDGNRVKVARDTVSSSKVGVTLYAMWHY